MSESCARLDFYRFVIISITYNWSNHTSKVRDRIPLSGHPNQLCRRYLVVFVSIPDVGYALKSCKVVRDMLEYPQTVLHRSRGF